MKRRKRGTNSLWPFSNMFGENTIADVPGNVISGLVVGFSWWPEQDKQSYQVFLFILSYCSNEMILQPLLQTPLLN